MLPTEWGRQRDHCFIPFPEREVAFGQRGQGRSAAGEVGRGTEKSVGRGCESELGISAVPGLQLGTPPPTGLGEGISLAEFFQSNWG